MSKNTLKQINPQECRSMKVEECASILGIGRATAYHLVNQAEQEGKPFSVYRIGNSLLISRRSFNTFLDEIGF